MLTSFVWKLVTSKTNNHVYTMTLGEVV